MKTNDLDIHMDKATFNSLDTVVLNANKESDLRITKKLLVNMGLMFLINELTTIEIKSQMNVYPVTSGRKRIAFRLINPQLTEQVNALATRTQKHILVEIALNRLFKKMEETPLNQLISEYVLIGGVL